jgi:multiple sugar transport system ATP-binding protein
MKDGEMVQTGTPEEVYYQSTSTFVAGFIGTPPTNLIEAEYQVEDGQAQVVTPYFSLPLGREAASKLAAFGQKELLLGIRPENILLAPTEDALLATTCLVCEPQGSHQIVAVELGETLIKITAPPQPRIHTGETLHLAFKPGTVHYFDPETGSRIQEDRPRYQRAA